MNLISEKYNFGRLKAFIISLSITLVYIIAFVFRGISWETNDDPAIIRVLTQSGNSYVPFLGKVLGWFVHKLYVIIPSVNHWTVLSYVFIFVGITALVYAIFVRYNAFKAFLTTALFLFVTWYACLNIMNFTRTAIIVAVGGVALIINSIFLQGKLNKTEFIIGVILLLLGGQIRFECSFIAVAFLGALSLIYLLKDDFHFKKEWFLKHLKTMLLLVFVAVGVFASYLVNGMLLTEQEKEFEHYNDVRSQIVDYTSNYDYNNWDLYAEQTGISKEDLETYFCWISEDTEVFDIESLENVASLSQSNIDLSTIKDLLKNNLSVIFILIAFCVSKIIKKRWSIGISILGLIGLAGALLIGLAYVGRLPDRVFISIILCAFASVALIDDDRFPSQNEGKNLLLYKSKRIISFILLCSCSIAGLAQMLSCVINTEGIGQKPNESVAYNEALRNETYDIINKNSNNIYIMPICSAFSSVYFAYGPWDTVSIDYCSNLYFLGGWDARMPHNVQGLAERGIDNPMRALYQKDNVYSIYDPMVLRHLRTHYNDRMTVSGVSGRSSLLQCTLVQYSEPIDSENIQKSNVKANVDEFYYQQVDSSDAWYLSGALDGMPDNLRSLYFNVSINGNEYSYKLGLNDLNFCTYLYNISEEFDLKTSNACFVAEFYDGTYQKIEMNYN